MSGLATLLKRFGAEHGIEVDDDELESLGLSIDDTEPAETDLDVVLAGEAAGAVEIFLADPRSTLLDGKALEADGLMWEPIIREGQWAVRPGAKGQKVRRPLKVIPGKSKNQRKEIGLQDIVDAFNDDAIEHVTVPTSHDNDVTQNTGFIKGLKIAQATIRDKKSKADKKVAVLMGGYDIRLPDIKQKMELGTIASRSAGLLYDYVNTDTGKTYPVALEHVALTNKPWITGMKAFGRKLVKALTSQPIGLSLSDEDPDAEELLAQDDALESIELATAEVTWDQEDDPDWLREQTNCVLRAARASKDAAQSKGSYVEYDAYPRYRCVKARPGLALVADGWGDEANFWTVPISVVDGLVQVDENLENWKASKRVFVPDEDRKDFPEGREPLDEEQKPAVKLSRIELTRQARKSRRTAQLEGVKPDDKETTIHPRGGDHMAVENGTLQLSEEARKEIEAANKRAKEANERAERLEKQVGALLGQATINNADAFVASLRKDGFTEERGFTGVLTTVRDLLSEDDGEPAVQSDKFATDTNSTGELSLSDCISRIFKAFERTEDGKLKLGQQVVQPTEPVDETKLGDDGKPLPVEPEAKEFTELSEAEQYADLAKDNPELLSMLRMEAPSNGNGANGKTKEGSE